MGFTIRHNPEGTAHADLDNRLGRGAAEIAELDHRNDLRLLPRTADSLASEYALKAAQ